MKGRIARAIHALTAPDPGVKMVIVDFGTNTPNLTAIAKAVTRQAQEHFALPPPYGYGIGATIRVASNTNDVKPNEWLIGLFSQPDQPGALGYHDQTPTGQPLMKIFPLLDPSNVSVTISHEVLECLADPNCSRATQAPNGIFWSFEVCDGVERDTYLIDGVKVSNFALPPYFEHVQNYAGVKLDWLGLCKQPLEIRPGGYNQYFDPKKGWVMVQHPSHGMSTYRQAVGKSGTGRGAARKRKIRRSRK